MKLAIFGAFPQELKSVLRCCGCGPGTRPGVSKGRYLSTEIITAETGMGKAGIEPVFRYVAVTHRPDLVASIGFGGALYKGAKPGEVVFGTSFFLVSGKGLEPSPIRPARVEIRGNCAEGSVITVPGRLDKEYLRRMLPGRLPYPVCDMETFHLAKLSFENRVPFVSFRSITDCCHEDIPDEFFDVCGGNGNYSRLRALGVFLKKPRLVTEGLKFGLRSGIASKGLWRAVKSLIEGLQ